MTAPNIEAITASLRNCSLGGSTESPENSPAAIEATEEFAGVTVELNSEEALPYHWDQCLDMRTGEVYYINWKDGTRTSEDPRRTAAVHRTANISSNDDDDGEELDEDDDDSYCEDSSSSADDDADYDDFYGSTSSGNNAAEECGDNAAGEHVLVAAGCKSCFMYFMVSKRVQDCPKCGGCLLHLGRNGYF